LPIGAGGLAVNSIRPRPVLHCQFYLQEARKGIFRLLSVEIYTLAIKESNSLFSRSAVRRTTLPRIASYTSRITGTEN
jgi:hypothetical protein